MSRTKNSRKGKLAWKVALGLCLASGAVGGLAVKFSDQLLPPSYALELREAQEARANLAKDVVHAQGLSEAFISVSKAMRPSVVQISSVTRAETVQGKQLPNAQIPEEFRRFFGDEFQKHFENQLQLPQQSPAQHGQGTGVIVSEDGYIITNNHVVRGASELTVRLFDGREFTGEIVGQDAKTDVAVVKINAKNLMAAPIGDSDALQVGEWVLAMGSPFGLEQTVTSGIISAKGRGNVGITDYEDFIQTDAAINPGNSGGPLINMQGQVVGINTAIASRSGGYMGVGFAIPSKMVKLVADSLIKEGKVTRGWLGAAIQDLNEGLAGSFNYKSTEGVLIGDVVPDSPAAKAGLKSGDIVTQIDGKPMSNSQQLRNTIAATAPKTSVKLTLFRDGKTMPLDVVVGELDAGTVKLAKGEAVEPEAEAATKFGMTVQTITPQIRQQLGLSEETQGVVVTEVESGSAAETLGIRVQDVITTVGGKAVTSAEEYRDAMKSQSLEKGVRLQVARDGVSRFVFLQSK
jgi:serine protease Do